MFKRQPKISVIIPSYNSGNFLDDAIQSVVNQTYKNLEIVLINDGSTDKTEGIIKKWQEKDNRIQYIKHESNRGLSAARNDGIKVSKGNYIAFLDADDVWLPEKISIQLKKIEKEKVDIVFSNWYVWDFEKNIKNKAFSSNPINSKEKNILDVFLKNNFGNPSTSFLKKSVFRKVGFFDQSLKSSEDYDFWLRSCCQRTKIAFIERPLILYRVHLSQMTKNIYRMRDSRLRIFKKLIWKNPQFLIKHPILFKKIVLLQGYKILQDFLKMFKLND